MNLSYEPTVGVILAGGRASRMHFQEKGLIELQGQPLLAHIIERLTGQVDDLWLNINRHQNIYRRFNLQIIADDPAFVGMGPLAGVHAALKAFSRFSPIAGWLVICPCDSPFLPLDLVGRLISAARESKMQAAVVWDGHHLHPTFSAVHSTLLASVTQQLNQGEPRFGQWLKTIPASRVDFSNEMEAFININTPNDLNNIKQALKRY